MLVDMARLSGSQTSLREANRSNLLACIHRFGAMTQVEIAEATGLSAATVSNLVHQLVDDGELDTRNTIRNGRRATLVALAHPSGIGIGLSIERHDLRLSLIDHNATTLAEHRLPLASNHHTDTTMERAVVLINEALSNIGADPQEIVGLGVSVCAPVDSRTHTVAVPGILPGWDGFDIASFLRSAFDAPIIVENEANASTICEARVGAGMGHRDFVFVRTQDGVGAGIMTQGELWRGVTGLSGEIGHIQVDPLGSICGCGNRGCLNTVVDERRLVSLLHVTHGNMTLDDLVDAANTGDPGCRRVLADAAVRIGTVTASLCTCVDPEIVIVGGRLAMAGDTFLDPFRESLQRLLFPNALTPIDVVAARHPQSCASLGAAIMALEHARPYLRDTGETIRTDGKEET